VIGLVRKRHNGPGWVVFSELANSTGGNVRGFADAFAVGIWPSRGYEAHVYEFKASREDLKRELDDPRKADNIGKYADYFWLTVTDEKLIETLVIPEHWGILTPRGSGDTAVLRVVKKAPKQEAAPWTRGFVAAMVRHVHDKHVTREEYNRVKEDAESELRKRIEREVSWEHVNTTRAHEELLKAVQDFYKESGIDILHARWTLGNVAGAVKLIVDAQRDPRFKAEFLRMAEAHERIAATAREVATLLQPPQEEEKAG